MITDSFDTETEPIITLDAFYGEQKYCCDTCIITFSKIIYENILSSYPCEKLSEIRTCRGNEPIYAMDYKGKKIAFYLSGIGSAVAATNVAEANWLTGATKFIMFGSAGSLNKSATTGRYVVPTEAYRDEGMSYHYAPAADYIKIPGADTVADIFADINIPYIKGRVWTTDAMLRETRGLMKRRAAEGCIAVEMELAGVQAVCDYYGFQLYNFLMTGDVLDQPEYDRSEFSRANHLLDNFDLSLEIARRLR